jgi:L-fucono-1,5-lactonase
MTALRVDAHHHIWSLARGDYFWIDFSNAAQRPLHRDFGTADFEPMRAKWRIDRTVLVQAAPTVEETEYMLALAEATPWIGKVVGWIDFEDSAHRRHLERFARHPKFAGVRPMIQDIPDPDWMLRQEVRWGYDAVVALDLTFDALGHSTHADNFLRLLARYPSMRVVVDHGMKPAIRDNAFEPWAGSMARIAKETGAYCKLSGLVTEARRDWTPEILAPYVRHIMESFGPDRVMWGSDWPVVELAATYDRWRETAEQLIDPKTHDKVFGSTAARFYRLS